MNPFMNRMFMHTIKRFGAPSALVAGAYMTEKGAKLEREDKLKDERRALAQKASDNKMVNQIRSSIGLSTPVFPVEPSMSHTSNALREKGKALYSAAALATANVWMPTFMAAYAAFCALKLLEGREKQILETPTQDIVPKPGIDTVRLAGKAFVENHSPVGLVTELAQTKTMEHPHVLNLIAASMPRASAAASRTGS